MSEEQYILPPDERDNNKPPLSEDQLMAYLEGRLPAAKQHEVEQWLASDGMESDAIEGLHGLDAGATKQTVSRLNHNLRKTLVGKKKTRRKMNTDHFIWFATGLILLLIIVAYIVIRMAK